MVGGESSSLKEEDLGRQVMLAEVFTFIMPCKFGWGGEVCGGDRCLIATAPVIPVWMKK